ncbi:hypothetical protein [Hydrogenimonas sp. SS33]|uniref:hypothetical protein n=1 Tax=Hydrogenimonas leucolamina TaxID=2954236 RepID=UPI00336C15AE
MSQERDYLLRELPYEEWFEAATLTGSKMIIREAIGSLEELKDFFNPIRDDMIPSIRLPELAVWLRETLGDKVLAEKVEKILQTTPVYIEQCRRVREAVIERYGKLTGEIQGTSKKIEECSTPLSQNGS